MRATCAGVNVFGCAETTISVIFQFLEQLFFYFLLQLLLVMCSEYRWFHNWIKLTYWLEFYILTVSVFGHIRMKEFLQINCTPSSFAANRIEFNSDLFRVS